VRALVALALVALCGCPPGTTVPPTVVDTGVCVLEVISTDLLAGQSFVAAVTDAELKCFGTTGANSARVQALWVAHLAAEAKEQALRDAGGQ
jgi:hypothetical protein